MMKSELKLFSRVDELFDSSVSYEIIDYFGMPGGTFEVAGVPYLVLMMPFAANFGAFSNSEIADEEDVHMGAMVANYKGGDLWSGNFQLNTGNEFAVFSTALKIFEELLQKHKPEYFAIAALIAEQRDRLYKKMMMKLLKRIENLGYHFVEEEYMENTPFGEVQVFYLARNDIAH